LRIQVLFELPNSAPLRLNVSVAPGSAVGARVAVEADGALGGLPFATQVE
jgi:hypothetical protein